DTRAKATARKMILMQRDINEKNFNGRTQVTCNSCHRGSEHPMGAPLPDGVAMRHQRMDSAPKAADLFAKYSAAAGAGDPIVVRTGTLTAPNDLTHKIESKPATFVQAPGGKYSLVAGDRKIVSDGSHAWYDGMQLNDEPAFVFARLGR